MTADSKRTDPPPAPERADLLEALAARLAAGTSRGLWRRLFLEGGAAQVRFAPVHVSLLAAVIPGDMARKDLGSLHDLANLASRHAGEVDTHPPGGALVIFQDSPRALDLALELQRTLPNARLRMGLHAGWAWRTRIACGDEVFCAHLGPASDQAAQLALQATSGTIHISPAAFSQVADAVQEHSDCLVTSEYSGDVLTAVLLTVPPTLQSGFSTFASLGSL